MAVTYTYKINAVRVSDQDGLQDVVKEVDFTITGGDGLATFSHPVTYKLEAPDAGSFTAFTELSESQIVGWVESHPHIGSMKQHIAQVVAIEAAKLSLHQKPLPWAPPTPAAPAAPSLSSTIPPMAE